MIAEADVKALSKPEKLRLIEALWADLSAEDAGIVSPPWHEEALREAEKLHLQGKAVFSNWDETKERIRKTLSPR
jgi:putative addiction module component (TIGR02574 family)